MKHYRTHLAPILSLATDTDGLVLASLGSDDSVDEGVAIKGSAKIFDVENFDMINILQLPYTPRTCCWVHSRGEATPLLAMYVGRSFTF